MAIAASVLSDHHLQRFDRDGFAVVPAVLPEADMPRYRTAALAYADRVGPPRPGQVFRQLCQVWRDDVALRELTFHPRIIDRVSAFARRPMRLYHDQVLIKDARNGQASEFHQDRPYWPLSPGFTVSTWIALSDCPLESGCMSFIPGSHRQTGLGLQVITDNRALFTQCPDLEWSERVSVPLRAGGISFHQGWTAHRAGPNETDRPRVAFSAIYVEDGVRLTHGSGWPYPQASAGMALSEEGCPRIC